MPLTHHSLSKVRAALSPDQGVYARLRRAMRGEGTATTAVRSDAAVLFRPTRLSFLVRCTERRDQGEPRLFQRLRRREVAHVVVEIAPEADDRCIVAAGGVRRRHGGGEAGAAAPDPVAEK